MREYEIMYILNATLDDETRKTVIDNLNSIITNEGGQVVKSSEWGVKELAYEMDKHRKGYYVVIEVSAPIKAIQEYDRLVRINTNVIRHLIINLDERQ